MQSIKSISEHEGTQSPTGGDGDQKAPSSLLTRRKAVTLKSLNTRYLKLIRKRTVMGIGLRRILFAILMASMLLGVAFFNTFTCRRANAKGCLSVYREYFEG